MSPSESVEILLVEDDDAHAELVSKALRSANAAVRINRASDGIAALEYLRGSGKGRGRRPDLILLDLNMPRMNGHELLAILKSDPSLSDIPVTILTTSLSLIDRQRAYHVHANSYLVKPDDWSQFRAMGEAVLSYWGHWNRRAAG